CLRETLNMDRGTRPRARGSRRCLARRLSASQARAEPALFLVLHFARGRCSKIAVRCVTRTARLKIPHCENFLPNTASRQKINYTLGEETNRFKLASLATYPLASLLLG